MRFIPQPKQVAPLDGVFGIDAETLITIPAGAGDDIVLDARQLQDELCRASGRAPSIVKAYAPPRAQNVILLVCGAEQAAAFGVETLAFDAPESVMAQAYALTVSPSRAVAFADGPHGLFFAVQTLRQLARLSGAEWPAVQIGDWPALPYRGLMLDVSRGKVPTLVTLKLLVEELSHYKLNVLQLYTEHTFQFPRHPRIGAGCGSLCSQDILELDAFCRQHHVELMPNLQSFGHARHILTLPEYQHLAETDALWSLSSANEGTYTLLNELFGDLLPAFSSLTLNINCDETYDVGQGASRPLAEQIGVGRVYLNHILRIRELAARCGRRIQLWGDILLHHPELIGEVPDDVTLLDWHYGPAEAYPSTQLFAQAGRRFWVCPGVGSWNTIFPRLYGANTNIRNFVRDGVAAGAEGMLNTDWGDYGHYQHLGLSWYGYIMGAAQAWTGGTTTDEDFDAAFGPLFIGPQHEQIMQALHMLARTNELPGVHRPNRSWTILALFDEPLTGETVDGAEALPAETLNQMLSLAKTVEAICDSLAPGHPQALVLCETAAAARLTGYAARKTMLSQQIRGALRESATEGRSAQDQARRLYDQLLSLRALDSELEELRAEFESLWLARARRSEIHVALGYFSRLRGRYRAAMSWLQEQRAALLSGKPIDRELVTYDGGNYRTLWHARHELV